MPASKPLPSLDLLNSLLTYDGSTGKLFWKERPASMFPAGKDGAEVNAAKWNGRFAGKEITATLNTGYLFMSIFGRKVLAHRVIWKMVHGIDAQDIDHINGDPADNRLANLRDVSHQDNGRNMRIKKNNKSGVMGVQWFAPLSKWHARINVDGKTIHIGVFENFDDAVNARRTAEIAHGFHENHGRR